MPTTYKTIEIVNSKVAKNSFLIALRFDGYHEKDTKSRMVICLCKNCGREFRTKIKSLCCKRLVSCGCKTIENIIKAHQKYFPHVPKLVAVYKGMIRRCYNETDRAYRFYGALGVVVCDEWKYSYQCFLDWALLNGWRKGLHLDKDILGDGKLYSPTTCCFVTPKENMGYRKNTIRYEYYGEFVPLAIICEREDVDYGLVYMRLKRNPDKSIYEVISIYKHKKVQGNQKIHTMNCTEYQQLTPLEKTQFIGELVHACISDPKYFKMGQKLIKQAQDKGLFEGVVINPPSTAPDIIEPIKTDL